MSELHYWAGIHPEKTAVVMAGSGKSLSYAQLHQRSACIARWLVSRGLQTEESVAIILDNDPALFTLAWAARRVGLYHTIINHHLSAGDAAFIAQDCQAKVVFASRATLALARGVQGVMEAATIPFVLVDDQAPGFLNLDDLLSQVDQASALPARPVGRDMLYSSGTTGRSKGVQLPPLPHVPFGTPYVPDPEETMNKMYKFNPQMVYLSPAPLYHAAPFRFSMRTIISGGTCVVMEKFAPEAALAAIEKFRITHSQWVPTMFSRMLALPASVRQTYDLSSMRIAIHAAAPCPPHVKEAMLDWWGDILYEYYAGSEQFGATHIGPQEWRAHRGSVGKATVGVIHILDEQGKELPPGEVGTIYFSDGPPFEYHNDPDKTRQAYNAHGWATYGDIGHVDEEGYLYLSDRRADLILCGGVNLYPAEIENVLLSHPAVADAAIVGFKDTDLGEVPIAVVCLHEPGQASAAVAQQLVAHCRSQLGRLKLPRRVVFEENFPRMPTGKLARYALKARFLDVPEPGFAVDLR